MTDFIASGLEKLGLMDAVENKPQSNIQSTELPQPLKHAVA